MVKKELKPLKEKLLEAINSVLKGDKSVLTKKIQRVVKKSISRIVKKREIQTKKSLQ